jgi:hypothetical protein
VFLFFFFWATCSCVTFFFFSFTVMSLPFLHQLLWVFFFFELFYWTWQKMFVYLKKFLIKLLDVSKKNSISPQHSWMPNWSPNIHRSPLSVKTFTPISSMCVGCTTMYYEIRFFKAFFLGPIFAMVTKSLVKIWGLWFSSTILNKISVFKTCILAFST